MIGIFVDVVGFLDFWCCLVVIVVFDNIIGMVIGILVLEVKIVMFGFNVVIFLFIVFCLVVVVGMCFLVVFGLEMISNVVGVILVGLLVIVIGVLVDSLVDDRVRILEVVLVGFLVKRCVLWIEVF